MGWRQRKGRRHGFVPGVWQAQRALRAANRQKGLVLAASPDGICRQADTVLGGAVTLPIRPPTQQ